MSNNKSLLPFPVSLDNDELSIVDVVGPEMAAARSGNLLMDEVQIFGGLYQQKMIEKVDRDEIINIFRRGTKLMILSLIVGGVSNRFVTKLKIKKFDFLNMNIFFRLFVRLSIFSVSLSTLFFLPMLEHLLNVRNKLNTKYIPRMRLYQSEMDPLIMNPMLLSEPGMTDDEREYMKVFYDNMKSQAAMMKAQMKMMEEKEKKDRRK
jgi:hypothetical protein